MIETSAPAKIILLGEHAVVYNQPAIAVPVASLRATAHVEANSGQTHGLHIALADLDRVLPVDIESEAVDDALALTARLVLKTLNAPAPDVTIHVQSQIPLASGLGSGAAVTTALARALSHTAGQPLENPRLNDLVYEIEKLYHGTPSGIDNTVVVFEQPVYFLRGQPIEPVSIGQPLALLIGDTGKSGLTRLSVGDVRRLYESQPEQIQPILDRIGQLVRQARKALEAGELQTLGALMNENHTLLQQLTVSSPELDTLVQAARSVGALGAKLSGGGRGGNMIALVTPETSAGVKQALLDAGAARVFETTVEN